MLKSTTILFSAICFALSVLGCSDTEESAHSATSNLNESQLRGASDLRKSDPPVSEEPFEVENWVGVWMGDQPEYPLLSPAGEAIVIRGQAATVKGSSFQFNVFADGKVSMIQSHEDGRRAEFEGTWKGQLADGASAQDPSPRLKAIVCELAATSTGAYRQYMLMADPGLRQVQCIGTSSEPAFEVKRPVR